jgi:diacylglycerol kinase family enzyme
MPTQPLLHDALLPAAEPPARVRPARLTVVAREVELVVNGRASGAGAAVLERATAALSAAGARVRAHVTADEAELAAVVRGADGRRIVLAGGDGTVHALANLDLPELPAAALLPAGRANNIARALGIPVDWDAAAALAVRGRPAAIDALHVATPERSLYAVEGVSAGFHAAARHRYDGTNSADLAAGVRALAAELRGFRPHHVALRVDGMPLLARPAAQLFLSNLPYFGFGFHVDPMADPSDGRLEAIVLEASTRRDVVRMLAAARGGRHLDRPGVSWHSATQAQLLRPLPLVADAQPLGVTTATVTVAAGRLRLIAGERSPGEIAADLARPVAAEVRS